MTTKQKKHKAITMLKEYRNNPAMRKVTMCNGLVIVFTLAEIANDIANRLADSFEEYQQISDYLMQYC